MKRGDCFRSPCAVRTVSVCAVWPESKMKHIVQVVQPEWGLGRNTDDYEKAKRCEKIYSNDRQPEPLSEDRVFQLERG